MAEAQTQLEQDDIDTTEEKAKDIGKDLGVTEDETPDYEVVDEEDEKFAKEREPAPKTGAKERPQLSSKEKRALRKKRINEKFSEKDAIIRAQQEKLAQLEQWQHSVEGRLSGINRAEVDKVLNDNMMAFRQAEADHASAFSEGDGAKATKAMREMYAAQQNIDKLQTLKQQVDRQPAAAQTNTVDAAIISKAKVWAARNSWYDPNGKSQQDAIARALSESLAAEGFDPKTDDYWDELDDRIEQYLPNVKAKDEDEEDDEDDDVRPAPKAAKKRSSPPVAGGAARGDVMGKQKVVLPTAYIQALKDAGKWDDKTTRDRMIKRYLEGVKNQGA